MRRARLRRFLREVLGWTYRPPRLSCQPRRPSARRRAADLAAHALLNPRGRIPHFCLGTDGCESCAEMREAHRREEVGIHFVGWGDHANRGRSPLGTADTTRRTW